MTLDFVPASSSRFTRLSIAFNGSLAQVCFEIAPANGRRGEAILLRRQFGERVEDRKALNFVAVLHVLGQKLFASELESRGDDQ